MTSIFTVLWQIEPVTPPRPLRHCSACGASRAFRSSGKVRLNANGRRLDAWLIYKCESCDRTWNLPLMERVALATIAEAELQAMHQSDPAWVRLHAFDLAALARHCDRIEPASEAVVTRTSAGTLPGDWSEIGLQIDAPFPVGQRLDRLLAGELGIARGALQTMLQAGGLQVVSGPDRALRKPLTGRVALRFEAGRLAEGQRRALEESFG